jgi:hypothetical protein
MRSHRSQATDLQNHPEMFPGRRPSCRTQVAEASCIIAIVERRPQHIRRNTWRSRLYIDDVQEIVDVLGAEGAEVEISVPGYSTKGGADQLLQFTGKTLHQVEIRRPRPHYILVDLQPGRGSVWGAEDDATTVGLVNKTADVLRRCRRWPSIIVFNFVTPFVLTLSWATFVIVLGASEPAEVPWSAEKKTLLVAPLLPVLLLLGASLWISLRRHTVIVCSYRSEAPTYWRRNKDQITVAIIAGVVGTFLGTLITIVVTKALE